MNTDDLEKELIDIKNQIVTATIERVVMKTKVLDFEAINKGQQKLNVILVVAIAGLALAMSALTITMVL